MRQPGRAVRFPGWVWSLILATGAATRATSYLFRPPDENGLSLIEDRMSYAGWAVLLLIGSAVLTVGVLTWLTGHDWGVWLVFIGHVGLLALVGVFATSIALSALCLGQPWSGFFPLVVVCLMHTERLLCAGANIGRR